MCFQKQIKNLYKHTSIDTDIFLLVVWLGRSYYSGSGESLKVYRELILAQIEKATYKMSDWSRSNIEMLSLPHCKTFKIDVLEIELTTVRLGNIYNNEGRLVNSPQKRIGQSGLFHHYINITSRTKIKYTGLFNILKKSSYPYCPNEKIYENAPYYQYRINNTDFILPIHIINSFFYYKNKDCINHIIYRNLDRNFHKLKWRNNNIVMANFTNVSIEDAIFFSKFLFIKGNEKFNCFNKITDELMKRTLKSTNQVKCYMQGDFPFKGSMRLKVIGQYINVNDVKINKFIIYDILEFIDYPCPVYIRSSYYLKGEELISKCHLNQQKLYEKSINEKREIHIGPIDIRSQLNNRKLTQHSFVNSSDFKISYFSNVSNHYENIEVIDENNNYAPKKEILSTSRTDVNKTKNHDLYFKLFRNIINYIGSIKYYESEIYEMRMYRFIDKKTYPPIILCAYINYKGFNYYVLEYGFGYSIPIFRHKNRSILISYCDLEEIVLSIYREDKRWGGILFEQQIDSLTLHNDKLFIVSVLDHPNFRIGMKKAQESLMNSICENIKNDIK